MGKWKSILSLITLALVMSIYLIPASAQGAIQSLHISSIDISGFPAVKFMLQAIDSNNQPLAGLTAQAISVSENGTPVQFSMNPSPVGVRVIFLIGAGLGFDATGATGKSRISEMKTAIADYLSQMNASNSVSILAEVGDITKGDTTNLISDFTSSATDLQNRLDGYQSVETVSSSGYAGILDALSRLKQQTDGKKAFIIFLSDGIQNEKLPGDIYNSVINQLSQPGHPTIYTLLFRSGDDGYGARLNELARLGGGNYKIYSSQEITKAIYQSMGVWRSQYLITYRSASSSTGNRQIVVTTASNSSPASLTYSISLQPAQISIQEPTANSTIIRNTNSSATNQTGTVTDFSPLKVKVEWPDGHPRQITSISIVVNNLTQGSISNPTLDSLGLVNVPWDLRTYTKVGQNPVSVQAHETDELGLSSDSDSVPLIILIPPEASQPAICKVLPNSLCSAVVFISPFVNFLALGVALIALALVIVFRKKIVSGGAQIVESVGGFVERLTKPRIVSTPKAYLKVLKGADLDRTIFEIYGKTPIGRSRRDAELVFHENEEDSVISRLHCTILDEDNFLTIRDEDSQWGTFLNGNKLTALEPVELHDGDLIELGQVERGGIKFSFSLANPSGEISDPNITHNSDVPVDEDDEARKTKPRRR